MFSSPLSSTINAKTALILGHTCSGMGEKILALKFKRAVEEANYQVSSVVDIIELMGSSYESLASLNYDLADLEHSLIEEVSPSFTLEKTDIQIILSWCFSLAALFATGVHKRCPTVAKLFVHHPQERILTQLYAPADLLITESLLANERALHYGIAPERLLYLPHTYPDHALHLSPNRSYVERLAAEQNKPLKRETKVIGCVGRFEYGKNYEFAVEAVRQLVSAGEEYVLVLKGHFPDHSPYPDYKSLFLKMLETYQHEPWLLWDRQHTPFPQVIEEYSSFDLLLHPSGAEGGSHVIVECLGLHKPVIALDCSTNPYLFKNLISFVKPSPVLRQGPLPFYVPDIPQLCQALTTSPPPPDPKIVEERFAEKRLQERIPLLFNRDEKIIKELYRSDRVCYGLL